VLLTIKESNRIVWDVGLSIRHFIAALLVATQLAGSLPYLTCFAGQCASNAECSSVHCKCCGPNCPWAKSSHESHKRATACNQQCSFAIASKAITISNPQPIISALFGMSQLQPFQTAYAAPIAPSVHPPTGSNSPTLLSLSCALTI
jgi:hypothetical protein